MSKKIETKYTTGKRIKRSSRSILSAAKKQVNDEARILSELAFLSLKMISSVLRSDRTNEEINRLLLSDSRFNRKSECLAQPPYFSKGIIGRKRKGVEDAARATTPAGCEALCAELAGQIHDELLFGIWNLLTHDDIVELAAHLQRLRASKERSRRNTELYSVLEKRYPGLSTKKLLKNSVADGIAIDTGTHIHFPEFKVTIRPTTLSSARSRAKKKLS